MGKVTVNRAPGRALKHVLAAIGFVAFIASVLRPLQKPSWRRAGHPRMGLFRYGKFVRLKARRLWRVLGHGLVHPRTRETREVSKDAVHRYR